VKRRSDSYTPPSWARPGNRWTPWVFWPLLCLNGVSLVRRLAEGDSAVRVVVTAGVVLLFAWLLAANRTARRKRGSSDRPR
jgi:hypothetical protein